jgi:threonylcarbamoyladenosine tRNA methylthiotransferase MtaB
VTAPGTVAVSTLGCRLNQVESQEILAIFASRGFRTAAPDERPQIHVVNTCTVTGRADFSDRQTIRRVARENPGALLVVTGCYAQTDALAVARIPGVDWVVGNGEKYRLLDVLDDLDKRPRPEVRVGDVRAEHTIAVAPVTRVSGRSRAFVKIQDGCQHRCAFCIVPTARGGSRSQDPKAVVDQIETLVGAGYREITLTGVDIGHYGRDLSPVTSLAALIGKIADVADLRWLRLSSILPAYWTEELIEVVTGSRVVVPHLHLPLQSGSDRVLRLMRRPYNLRMYRALVDRVSAAMPGLGLGTDLIVGHPGEQAEDFAATMQVVDELPLSYLHVFPYSDRKGTEAAARADHVPPRVVRERSGRLRALGRAKNHAFRSGLVGQRRDVVVLAERDRETGFLVGLTSNYVEVLMSGPADLARRFARVRITAAGADRTFGVLEEVLG